MFYKNYIKTKIYSFQKVLYLKFIQIIFGKFIKSPFGSSKNYFLLEFWVKNLIQKIAFSNS